MIKVSFFYEVATAPPGDVDDVCRSVPEPRYLSFRRKRTSPAAEPALQNAIASVTT